MNRYLAMFCMIVLFVGTTVQADHVVGIRSAGDFYARIFPRVENQLVLKTVLFYDGATNVVNEKNIRNRSQDERRAARDERTQFKKLLKRQRDSFADVAKAVREVGFLTVDVSRPANAELVKAYQLKGYPTIMLFRGGKLLVNNDQQPLALRGNFANNRVLDVNEIIAFVRRYFDKDIQTIIDAKAKAEYELAKIRAANWGWGWGAPFYGWGYWGGCAYGWCY